MPRLLKEPLLHFLLLGGAVFALFALTRDPAESAPRDAILITAPEVRQLAEIFAKTWQRPPTPEEVDNLVEARIREEVFYREALAAGLDEDDTIVRRRLKQKLEFMLEDIAGQVTPTEQELQTFLDANADRFRSESKFSFRHVYLSTDRRADVEGDARELLARLRSGADSSDAGDRLLMVERAFASARESDVARVFGREFASRLNGIPTSEWVGPIRSGYGFHLVLLDTRVTGEIAKLDEVRDLVSREWSAARRREMNESLYQELRARYSIMVERE